MHEKESTIKLLEILSTEIARDGGASLVCYLKDYVSRPRQIEALVKKSIGCTKLLSFLEKTPQIFDVDRNSVPHFVKLLSDEYCQDFVPMYPEEHERLALQEKVLYTLRKRTAKLSRRQLPNDRKDVNIAWLCKECTLRLHFFLRSKDFYRKVYSSFRDVLVVGSPEWLDLVQPEFEFFLDNFAKVQNGKVQLMVERDDNLDVVKFAERLKELVDEDGGTQVCLSLLLHRKDDLKALLGGRDFLALAKEHEELFSNLVITPYGSDVELQSTKPYQDGRMAVDEIGLFSVASSKWGSAMAKSMVWACSHCSLELDPTQVTVLDLTASVGGHALALAKTTFSQVIAIEIDPHRAELCRENMRKHRMHTKVDVRNADAVELIPKLAIEFSNHQIVVVIDPPWGGVHYKRERKPLYLGQWLLEDVVQRVVQHFAPTLVGLRLPVNFVVRDFEASLHERQLTFDTLSIRKLGPQLFVILKFGAPTLVS